MLHFIRQHKAWAAAAALVVLVVAYAASIFAYAYIEAPEVVAVYEASRPMPLSLENLTEEQKRALLAVEDPNFYRHRGVDLSTPGAGWTTITQGLVKVLFYDGFSPGPLRYRKINQTIIALALDRRVSKDEQLRLFVNAVYLGERDGREVVGFEDGARSYFGKGFAELTREEYLALVATIVAPNDLSVATHPAENAERVRRIERLLAGGCSPRGLGDVYYEGCR